MALWTDHVINNTYVSSRTCNLCGENFQWLDTILSHIHDNHTDEDILSYIGSCPVKKIEKIFRGKY